jgi:trk/ktr system potassium uptake protein
MKQSILVIGLGRFGSAAALELMRLGHDVLAVDRDEAVINDIAPDVTHALQLDATDIDALRGIGATEFDHAIVAISGNAEPSIFTTMALKQLGIGNVVAKAGSSLHGAILERVGADRVVYPEREMGARVAHLFAYPDVVDYIDVSREFGLVMLRPPSAFVGRSLGELDLEGRYQLTPVALRRGEQLTVNPSDGERVEAGDMLTLVGRDDGLARLPGDEAAAEAT